MGEPDQLFKAICRRAGEAVVRYKMISAGDRLLVGLSGGKDSLALMHVLAHLRQVAPVDFDFCAATFDPGYPEFGTSEISRYCHEHNWRHEVVKLDMAALLEEKRWTASPCVLCSRLRRGKLYGLAKKLNCNRLALGQHLDDIVISLLMSLCRGQGVRTMAPVAHPQNPDHPTVIRPLALVPEKWLSDWAQGMELPQAGKCRFYEQLESGDRAFFRRLLAQLEARIPDIRANVLNSLRHVEPEHLP